MARQSNTAKVEETKGVVAPASAPKYNGQALIKEHGSKSAAIRFLNSKGETTGAIAKILGIRYQHARNVLVTPLTGKKLAAPVGSETSAE